MISIGAAAPSFHLPDWSAFGRRWSIVWRAEVMPSAMRVSNDVCSYSTSPKAGCSADCGRSIVSFDRPFYDFWFLNAELRQMRLHVVRS